MPYWRVWGVVDMPRWMQTSTTRWLHVCLSSFNTMLMYTRMRHSDLLNQVIGLAASNQSALIKSSVVMQQ